MRKTKNKNKKKNIKLWIAIVLISIGLIVYISPLIMQWVTDIFMNKSIENFTETVSETEKSQLDELYEKMQEYNENIYINGQEQLVDAFSYEKNDFDLSEYGFSENIVGVVDIPKINVKIPIYLGATSENLYKGAAHLSKTSMPIGGINTNSVISAHRGLIRNKMFRHLDNLQIGDEVYITNLWETLEYKVSEIKIILPTEISEILIQEGKDLVTLITCHPFRVNTHRYVVYCERVDNV